MSEVLAHSPAGMRPAGRSLLPRLLGVPVLAAGPLVVLAVLHHAVATGAILPVDLPAATIMLAVFWSPMPWSVPALVLQDVRDDALVGTPWLPRALALVPWLTLSRRSPARPEMLASLVGFALALAAAAQALHG